MLAIAAAVAALAAGALYLPHLDTGFASEDFLILARLSRQGLLATLREELVSPWLGLVAVGFWRPVSTFLLGLELAVFGLNPARFHAAHWVVHAFNAWLVARIVAEVVRGPSHPRRGSALAARGAISTWVAIAAAALFAIHPFHPSAVLFAGAFATLFGATFALLAIWFFLEAHATSHSVSAPDRALRRRRRLDLASIACFALALGCYEATVVLPAVLLVTALLLPASEPRAPAHAGRATRNGTMRRTAPFFAVAAAYLVTRTIVLGASIGGYGAFRERYLAAPLALAADFAAAAGRILHPSFGSGAGGRWAWTIGIAAVVVAAVFASLRRETQIGHDAGKVSNFLLRGALVGPIWIALFLAPFAFVGLVPANGRYAYLAIAGAVLALCALGNTIAVRWPRTGAALVAIALIAVAVDWALPLRRYLSAYDEASALVAVVRADLIHVAAEHATDDSVLLIANPPDFIKGGSGEPIAKVLQYGLAESVRPPFGPVEHAPIPLPFAVSRSAQAALDALPGTIRYRWDSNAGRLMPVAPESPQPAPLLEVESYEVSTGSLEVSCHDCAAARLVLLTSSLPIVISPVDAAAGRARFEVSSDLLRGLAKLDEGDAFFWVEEPAKQTVPVRLSLRGDGARSFAEAAAKMRRD